MNGHHSPPGESRAPSAGRGPGESWGPDASRAPGQNWSPGQNWESDGSRSHAHWLRLAALIVVVIGVLALAAAAFVLSYPGVRDTALSAGVTPRLARIYPMIFDGVLVVAFAAAISLQAARWWLRFYAWLSVLVIVAAVATADSVHAMAVQVPKRPIEATGAIVPWVVLLVGLTLLYAMARQAWPRRKTTPAPAGGPALETAEPPMARLAAARTPAALPPAPEPPAPEPAQPAAEHTPVARNAQPAEEAAAPAGSAAAPAGSAAAPAGTAATIGTSDTAITSPPGPRANADASATVGIAGGTAPSTPGTAGGPAGGGPAGGTAPSTPSTAGDTTTGTTGTAGTPATSGTGGSTSGTGGTTAPVAPTEYQGPPARVTLEDLLTPRAEPLVGSHPLAADPLPVRHATERDDPSDADAEAVPHFTRLRSTPTPPEEPWIVETSDE